MRILPIALVTLVIAMPAAAQEPEVSVHTLVTLLEGPTFDCEGSLYFTDVVSQRIMKKAADGKLSVYRENSNSPWHRDGCESYTGVMSTNRPFIRSIVSATSRCMRWAGPDFPPASCCAR